MRPVVSLSAWRELGVAGLAEAIRLLQEGAEGDEAAALVALLNVGWTLKATPAEIAAAECGGVVFPRLIP